jgi:hypothetical protein
VKGCTAKSIDMKIEPTEAIKEQIEQKAREYALIPIDVNIDTYASEEQIGSYNDFLAGAEAMREIANTWYDIEMEHFQEQYNREEAERIILQSRYVYDEGGNCDGFSS